MVAHFEHPQTYTHKKAALSVLTTSTAAPTSRASSTTSKRLDALFDVDISYLFN